MMRDIMRSIYSHRTYILWGLICILIFAAIFALYGIDMRVIWYPLLLCAVVTAVFFHELIYL